MQLKLELLPVPVADIDRALRFYADQAGFTLDVDVAPQDGVRFVQLTPPGSACSICFGVGLGMMPEGSKQMIQVVIDSAEEARDHLRSRGVEASDVDEQPWGRFVTFEDPDGNRWSLQQMAGPVYDQE